MNENKHRVNQGIGRPINPQVQNEPVAQQLMAAMMAGTAGVPSLNPEALKGAPPWVAYLLNNVQNSLTQLEALKLALFRRGLLTEVEFTESLMQINRAVEQQFTKMAKDVDRRVNQGQGGAAPVGDPRRPPGT